MTKRGNRGLDQRVTSVIPSATLAVSSTSATKPVPRVRYQSACVSTTRRSWRRPTRDEHDPAVQADQPRGSCRAVSQGGVSGPSTIDVVLAMFASTHVSAATETVRQQSLTG